MKQIRWETFEGKPYEVGFQLGKYWAGRLKELQTHRDGRAFLKDNPYPEWLNEHWNSQHAQLLAEAIDDFPELMKEISGIAEGSTAGGYPTSVPAVFGLVLGEFDDEYKNYGSCSTIACHDGQGSILAHNEEDEVRSPLCFSNVSLKTRSGVRKFLSVSYPFQLFGTSVGATTNFAFSGNSIGMGDDIRSKIYGSLRQRVPKTFLTRLFLEQGDIQGINSLLRKLHSILPSHWFVCSKSSIYSIRVRPRKDTNKPPGEQVTSTRIVNSEVFHTNHFFDGSSDDRKWSWSPEYLEESQKRLSDLKQLREKAPGSNFKALRGVLSDLQSLNEQNIESTEATIVFRVDDQGTVAVADDYFTGSKQPVGESKIFRGQ